MGDELEIKPSILSGSISRIWEHLKSTRRTSNFEEKDLGRRKQRSLPHGNIALGAGIALGIIPVALARSGIITLPSLIPAPLGSMNTIIFLFMVVALPVSFIIQLYFLRKELKNRKYIVRSEGVDVIDNYLDRGQKSASFANITDVELEKPFLQRAFGTGNIVLNTSGSETDELRLEYVKNAETLQDELSGLVSGSDYRQEP